MGHFAMVCPGRQEHQPQPTRPPKERRAPRVQTSNIRGTAILNPASSVVVQVISPNGSATITAFPDLKADISAAGTEFLALLGEHELNRLPSQTTPRAAI